MVARTTDSENDDGTGSNQDTLLSDPSDPTTLVLLILMGAVCVMAIVCCLLCAYFYGQKRAQQRIIDAQSVQMSRIMSESAVIKATPTEDAAVNLSKEGDVDVDVAAGDAGERQGLTVPTTTGGHYEHVVPESPLSPGSVSHVASVVSAGHESGDAVNAGDEQDAETDDMDSGEERDSDASHDGLYTKSGKGGTTKGTPFAD